MGASSIYNYFATKAATYETLLLRGIQRFNQYSGVSPGTALLQRVGGGANAFRV